MSINPAWPYNVPNAIVEPSGFISIEWIEPVIVFCTIFEQFVMFHFRITSSTEPEYNIYSYNGWNTKARS